MLGLYPPVSFDEIAEAHRDLVQVWHPDRFEQNPRLRTKAEEELKAIQEAFSCLKVHCSKTSSDNGTAVAVTVRKATDPGNSARHSSRAFDFTPDEAQRLFKRAIDGKLINHASTVPFPKLLYISRYFGISDAADIRVVIVSLDGSLEAGWVLTRSGICCRGLLSKADIPFIEISQWEFSLGTLPNFAGDRLWSRLSGREHQLLELRASRINGSGYSAIQGLTDAHTQLINHAVLALQMKIVGS